MMTGIPFATANDAFGWFLSFHNAERTVVKTEFRLDRIREMLSRFGNPERHCPSFHVAGSKGKGSVTSMISSILTEAGYRTGRYLSPHVEDYAERITLDGAWFPDSDYARNGNAIKDWYETAKAEFIPVSGEPTFFELATLLAFLMFRDSGCERIALETGLGGRLDATNAVTPRASVLTPIELEHVEYLGDTIEKIAAEKAGIIKKGIPVFSGIMGEPALLVFRETAALGGSPFYSLAEELESLESAIDTGMTVMTARFKDEKLFPRPLSAKLSLCGTVQAENAALAALAIRVTEPDIPIETIERGLGKCALPARFETVRATPPVILDGAHTERSVALALSTFNRLYRGDAVLLFGCAADKNAEAMASILAPRFSTVIVTAPGNFKSSDPERIAKAFEAAGAAPVLEPDTEKAVGIALESQRGNPLLVTGSFYLCAIARKLVMRRA